ncbi:hypothetical protein ACFT5B_01260 [Luteimicrobium sp. NPDC057192]|uniref:alpha-L-rhamnosidase-related protein n=1 Tax=Luteimicrobium sp. NPDC057192 TaxID=3346042 RepID=UPI00363A7091
MTAWIWDAFHRETPNQLVLFRRVVEADAPLVDGALDVAARGPFRVWVDGVLVAHHDVQSSAPGADAVRCDLAAVLGARRERRATVVVGVYLLGVGTHHQPRALGGLWVEGTLRTADGAAHDVGTSSAWSTHVPASWRQNTPQMVWSAGFTEWSDRTLAPDGLTAGAGDGWAAAVEYDDDQRPRLLDRDVVEEDVPLGPFLHETGTLLAPPPDDVPPGPAIDRATAGVALGASRLADSAPVPRGAQPVGRYGLWVVPHQLVGFLTLTVDADEPTTIDVLAGEAVDAHGWPTATRQGIAAVDTVVVPAGRTTHRFWHRRTFRALAWVAHGTGAVAVDATFATITARRPEPVFRSGVDRYDRMHAVSVATARVGRQDLYEDCPLREGGHYVADAGVQALFDLATTGVPTTSRRSLLQFAAAQDDDGMIPALSPSGTRHRIPDFALQWPSFVEDHVRFTGDRALLDEVYPAVVRCLDWAATHTDATTGRLDLDRPGWWSFVDWHAFTPDARQAGIDAQHAVALRSGVALAEAVGDDARAAVWRAALDRVLAGLGDDLRHPHAATILLCGLDPNRARALVAPSALDGFVPDTGYFTFWVCRAHLVLGNPRAARELLDLYWGTMLDAGAGTWWERWSPTREVVESTGSSLCHPWSAGPLVLLPMLALGVDPFARFEADSPFEPADLGGRVTAALHTPWGVVEA